MSGNSKDVFARLDREAERHVEELKDYLRIPSISTDPAYRAEVERCADWLIARMQDAGLATEKIATAGHPLVYAEWIGAGPARRPCSSTATTTCSRPIRSRSGATRRSSRPTRAMLVARGATDDKGQSYAHVKGVAALLAERGKLPVNVKFIVEGEEEAGGEAIEAFVARTRAASSPATAWWSPTPRCTRPASRRSPTASRGSPTSRSASRGRTATCTRASTAAA